MKRVIFIQIGTGVFAVETDQIRCFTKNAIISNYGNKSANQSIIGFLRFFDEMIPVLDLQKWFGQNRMEICDKSVFVIMSFGGKSFSFQISKVINVVEVPGECFHVVPSACKQENTVIFKDVIDWNGTLYLKISAENVLKAMIENAGISFA